MIYALIIAALAVVILALAIVAVVAIRKNSRLKLKLLEAVAGDKALTPLVSKLKQENITVLQEISSFREENADLSKALEATRKLYNHLLEDHKKLEARNTALVEAMEARPTQPKRTVRKNVTTGEQQ